MKDWFGSGALTGIGCRTGRFYRAPGKIDLLAASFAHVRLVEFIRENLFLFAAFRAPA
jgi:hypothetical protein